MNKTSFLPGLEVRMASAADLSQLRSLAQIIFPFTYKDIVPGEQIDYMMDMFYTEENLLKQFEEGQVFLIMYDEGKPTGFASYSPFTNGESFKLNKIYIHQRSQGKGHGKWLLNEVTERVKAAGGKTMQLNVNKNNKAVGFYETMGFSKLKAEMVDIGNNYFMDDYVMQISL